MLTKTDPPNRLKTAALAQGKGRSRLARRLDAQFFCGYCSVLNMKRVAMRRMDPDAKELPPLNLGDLDEALGRVQPRF